MLGYRLEYLRRYLGPVPETLFSDGALQFRQLGQLDGDISAPVKLIIGANIVQMLFSELSLWDAYTGLPAPAFPSPMVHLSSASVDLADLGGQVSSFSFPPLCLLFAHFC